MHAKLQLIQDSEIQNIQKDHFVLSVGGTNQRMVQIEIFLQIQVTIIFLNNCITQEFAKNIK